VKMKGRILMADERQNSEKKFIFPENVDSSYGIFLGLSLRELLIYVLPIFILGIVFVTLPPHGLYPILTKAIIVVLIMTVILAVLSTRPDKYRNNVRLIPHLQMKAKYKSRQHVYFKKQKNRQEERRFTLGI